MREIILIGGGGHCKSVIDVIECQGKFQIIGIVDKPEYLGERVLNYPVIGNDSELPKLAKKYNHALITVGQIHSSELRKYLFNQVVSCGFKLPAIISPRAYVSGYASIGSGVVVMHDAVVNANTSIADNCIINSKVLIEHDCKISEHCHISTGAIINGGVEIGPECFIGSGSITKESIKIDKKSFIKAGSLIT